MLTRKDYTLLANLISQHNAVEKDKFTPRQLNVLCSFLRATNPRFSREKFVAACEKGATNDAN